MEMIDRSDLRSVDTSTRLTVEDRADSVQDGEHGNRKQRRAALAMAKQRVSLERSGLNSF